MKNKDTDEFELVVGDKQLLSGFFLGVVLLAVVFALGYVLGRSSPKSASTETTATTTNTEGRPQPASPVVPASVEPPPSTPANAAAADPAQTAAVTPPPEAPPQPTTVPARDPAAAAPPPKPVPPLEANATYWQVAAASPSSADAFFQTLKDKGFPVITRPGPKDLIVVWVGPYFDKETYTRAKKQLEDAGFNTLKRP